MAVALTSTPSFQETGFAALFENLPKMIRPEQAALVLSLSKKTIYDWHYRAKQRRVPKELFLKLNRSLYLRTDILKDWIISQNPSLR